jgi:hypothetical protein
MFSTSSGIIAEVIVQNDKYVECKDCDASYEFVYFLLPSWGEINLP